MVLFAAAATFIILKLTLTDEASRPVTSATAVTYICDAATLDDAKLAATPVLNAARFLRISNVSLLYPPRVVTTATVNRAVSSHAGPAQPEEQTHLLSVQEPCVQSESPEQSAGAAHALSPLALTLPEGLYIKKG